MSKKEIDIDGEIEKIARKTNINIRRREFAFENQIKRLEDDIENLSNKKLKEFDENKDLASQYLGIDYKVPTIDRYREKLKKI